MRSRALLQAFYPRRSIRKLTFTNMNISGDVERFGREWRKGGVAEQRRVEERGQRSGVRATGVLLRARLCVRAGPVVAENGRVGRGTGSGVSARVRASGIDLHATRGGL
jgi:hypothetical protein